MYYTSDVKEIFNRISEPYQKVGPSVGLFFDSNNLHKSSSCILRGAPFEFSFDGYDIDLDNKIKTVLKEHKDFHFSSGLIIPKDLNEVYGKKGWMYFIVNTSGDYFKNNPNGDPVDAMHSVDSLTSKILTGASDLYRHPFAMMADYNLFGEKMFDKKVVHGEELEKYLEERFPKREF